MSEQVVHAPSHNPPVGDSGFNTPLQAEIAALYAAGRSRKEICALFGCSSSTITRAIRNGKIELQRGPREPVSAELIERLRELWRNGRTITAIAKALDITKGAVSGLIRRNKITRDPLINVANHRAAHRSPSSSRPKPELHVVPQEKVEPVPFLKLQPGKCKWPIDVEGSSEPHFCGCTAIRSYKAGGPLTYCRDHSKRAFQPQPKKRSADRPNLRGQVPLDYRRWN